MSNILTIYWIVISKLFRLMHHQILKLMPQIFLSSLLMVIKRAAESLMWLLKAKVIRMLGFILLATRWFMRQIKRNMYALLSLRLLQMMIQDKNFYHKIKYRPALPKKRHMKNQSLMYLKWHQPLSWDVSKMTGYFLCQQLLVKN